MCRPFASAFVAGRTATVRAVAVIHAIRMTCKMRQHGPTGHPDPRSTRDPARLRAGARVAASAPGIRDRRQVDIGGIRRERDVEAARPLAQKATPLTNE